MGIYIQGMELQKEKKITLTLFPDGRVYENHGERLWGNGKDCIPWKAVPVPPHGRLGDLDALHKLFIKKAKEYKGIGGTMLAAAAWCVANAPTIIEPEEAQQ